MKETNSFKWAFYMKVDKTPYQESVYVAIYEVILTKAYLEPCQTSQMELFLKIVGGFQLLSVFTKSSILTNSLPVHPFSTSWKHQKTLRLIFDWVNI